MTSDEVLANSVSCFNQQLRELNVPVQLKDKPELFRLHLAKKNGLPKEDWPRTLDPLS